MNIKRQDTQKAPGTMTDTYLSKLGLLLGKKCEGWEVGQGLPCERELCQHRPNQKTRPSFKVGVSNLFCNVGPPLRVIFLNA